MEQEQDRPCDDTDCRTCFGIEPKEITKDKLYRSALDLYSLHDGIEDYLHDRVCSIFDLEDTVYLFDLSNAYMESTKLSELRQFGRSKEKRSDCPIVVLGAVVNKDGFLVRTMIFSGSWSRCQQGWLPGTYHDILRQYCRLRNYAGYNEVFESSFFRWKEENRGHGCGHIY